MPDRDSSGPRARGPLAGSVELVPGLLAVGVFTAWAAAEGGFPPTAWYPGALFLLGLLGVSAVVFRERLTALPLRVRLAVGLLGGFVIWSFLSIAWADSPGIAWDGANRTLLYLLAFALFALLPWSPRSAAVALAVASVGLAGVGAAVVLELAGSSNPELLLIGDRLAEPTGYPNAVAALFVGGFWPAVFLASRREVPWPARGLLLAVAGLLLQIALLPQSRGALIVFPIALVIYVVAVPQRLRAVAALLLALGATALASGAILDVFAEAEAGDDLVAAVSAARDAIAISFVALAVVGSALAALDSRARVPEPARVAVGRGALALAAVVALAGVGAFVATVGNPVSWADERWEDFKSGYDPGGFGSSRFSGDLGSNRYDFWRVGLGEELAAAPLAGDGADNFAIGYLEDRRSDEEPLYPHSLPVRVLAGTGVIGALLVAGFFLFAVLIVLEVRRRGSAPARGLAGAVIGVLAYWALHGAGDWLWSFPAITAPVFAWLGMVGALLVRQGEGDGGRSGAPPSWAWLLGGITAAFAALSLLLPWGAARDVEIAATDWPGDPDAAFERLDRARSLNFLSERADLTAGTIALSIDDAERARESFELALERQPNSWFALLQLGSLDLDEGETERGLARLERAAALNPLDDLIQTALRRGRAGRALSSAQIEARLLERVCARVGSTTDTRFCD